MRFIANGPSLPDELLSARDAGQVIFFCGAGVSQAGAKLPNFVRLAEDVLDSLGSALDSPARRLFEAGRKFERDSGLTGLVATDRIFGLLEREFDAREVQAEVAKALVPRAGYVLDAHRTVLDLSRDRAGVARLVTTNFDLLFEECDPELGSFSPPHLPDPRRERDFRGVVHIHGRVDQSYSAARDDEFVLSSADFGRAYLADGWATRYIQTLLQRYKIVFLGYSADDPPVQYLLEALSRGDERPNALYAFQSGDVAQAAAQWAHKGVTPIPYDSSNGHAALWDTLHAWADRARDVDAWMGRIISEASTGPAQMQPHQRGIIAHLAATPQGAKHLASAASPPPASWLCVLDRFRRYGDLAPLDMKDYGGAQFDPFEAFGLDTDETPPPVDPANRLARREVPEDAWDGFASTPADRQQLPIEAVGRLRGAAASGSPKLPTRLWHLGSYLVRVADQPAALWWAAHQHDMHPDIRGRLDHALRQDSGRFSPAMRRGWRLLLSSWDNPTPDANRARYTLDAAIKQDGWSTRLVREAMAIYRPYVQVRPPFASIVPDNTPDLPLESVIRAEVEYPRPYTPLNVPAEHLAYACAELRRHLEYAVTLERELSGRENLYLDTIRAEPDQDPDEDGYKLTGLLVTFTKLFTQLMTEDPQAARAEYERWPTSDDQVFTRLQIWAASQPALMSGAEAARVFLGLSELSFWTNSHERDLLFGLRDRWADLSDAERVEIEARLLTGSFPWEGAKENVEAVNAHYRLNRLEWFHRRGIQFSFDYDATMATIREAAPDWEPRFADLAAQPQVGPVHSIETDTDPTALRDLPLNEVLAAAREATDYDFLAKVERRPFGGLIQERPAFALAVLTDAGRRGEFPLQEWGALIRATGRGEAKPRLLRAIGKRMARLSSEQVSELAHPMSDWLEDRAKLLLVEMPDVFEAVWEAMVTALTAHPAPERFRRANEGWLGTALNQPTGRMATAVFSDPVQTEVKPGQGLPESWKVRLGQLLALPGDARRHAIAIAAQHLAWLYERDQAWIEENLAVLADCDSIDSEAFWSGYLIRAQMPPPLLFNRLLGSIIALTTKPFVKRDQASKLGGFLLLGWGAEPQLVPDVLMREMLIHASDDIRGQVLWYLQRWSLEADSKWPDRLQDFFGKVWPRQLAARTPLTSGRLVDLALAMPARFPEIVEMILPRLGPAGRVTAQMSPLLDVETGIALQHPKALLDLLWTILPVATDAWPYEIGKVLDALGEQDATREDPRLLELLRRDPWR